MHYQPEAFVPEPPPWLETLAARVRETTGIDRAAVLALISRSWQLVAAPLTLFIIASRFSPEMQGFYYTFASLLALQSFAELGLSIVIVNVASHEWSRLSLDAHGSITGDPDAKSRLIGFGRLVFGWYAIASLLFAGIVSLAGFRFLSHAHSGGVSWQGPWFALVALAAAQLWILSLTSLLEGCNQVATVQRYRVIQSVVSTIAFATTALLGAGLWAAVAVAAGRLITDLSLVGLQYRHFFSAFLRHSVGPSLSWGQDVWPMQWRLGLSGIVNYFAFSLFNPVMFRYQGPVVAGQMGMTLQVIGGLQALAIVFLTTKVPQFGIQIARRDYPALDRLWKRASVVSLTIVAIGGGTLLAMLLAMNAMGLAVANRLLGVWPTLFLVVATICMQVSQCQTAYMRAHRQEPIVVMSVTTSLASGALIWLCGRMFGAEGSVVSYSAVAMIIVVWETLIWRAFKARAVAAAS